MPGISMNMRLLDGSATAEKGKRLIEVTESNLYIVLSTKKSNNVWEVLIKFEMC